MTLEDPNQKHDKVSHAAKEYGYFATLKCGIDGVCHHASKGHLNRYLSEFDFRYNHRDVSYTERAESALNGSAGKRLKYRDSCGRVS